MKLKKLTNTVLIGLTGFSAIACSHGKYVDTKGSFIYFNSKIAQVNSKRAPETVQVFYKTNPTTPYSEAGIVEAFAMGNEVSLQDLFPELKKQAALMNADGIVKVDLQRFNQTGDALHATAVAIRFTTPQPAIRAAASVKK
mgnify:CR=1 FL=1